MDIATSSLISNLLVRTISSQSVRNCCKHAHILISSAYAIFHGILSFRHSWNLHITASISNLLNLHLVSSFKDFLTCHSSVGSNLVSRKPILNVRVIRLLHILLLDSLTFFLSRIARLHVTLHAFDLVLRSRSSTSTTLNFHRQSLIHPLLMLSCWTLVLDPVHFQSGLLGQRLISSQTWVLSGSLTLNFLNFYIWAWAGSINLTFRSPVLILDLILLILLLSLLLSKNSIDLFNAWFLIRILLLLCRKMPTRISSKLSLLWLMLLSLWDTIFIIWILVNCLELLLVLVVFIVSVVNCGHYSLLILSLIHVQSVTSIAPSWANSALREWSLPRIGFRSGILFSVW